MLIAMFGGFLLWVQLATDHDGFLSKLFIGLTVLFILFSLLMAIIGL